MENRGDTDAGAEVLRVSGDRDQGLGRCLEQQVVDDGLVIGDVGDGCRQREHDMEVRPRQQIGFARRKPVLCRRALALRAMPVAAANGHFPLAALWAKFVMGSWLTTLPRCREFLPTPAHHYVAPLSRAISLSGGLK